MVKISNSKESATEIKKLESYTWSGATTEVWNLGILLYTMLHIQLPFKDYKEIMGVKIDSKISKDISLLGYDLICKLLEKDYKKRISFEEIFGHPWLKDYCG